ncbi:MAG: T9SS type A sorting domain-containing protein [Paludibacter sp.]|nr:T9SS type A sorting domain-containing protein [Paludibacter sp.]
MKKITILVFAFSLTVTFAHAGGNWASTAVSITKDAGTAYLYLLNNEGWAKPDGNNYSANTAFNAFDFGTPATLVLNGGAGCAWADAGDWYDGTSFVIYYRVYVSTETPGSWSQIALPDQTYSSGNDRRYDKSDANIDILALATAGGTNTYTLEVVMSKNQFYTGGNWLSMVPGGQGVAYNSTTAGYKATFVKSITTQLDQKKKGLTIITENGNIKVNVNGAANVQLYTVAGQLIRSASVTNQFTHSVKSGVYLLKVNGETRRVLVQ